MYLTHHELESNFIVIIIITQVLPKVYERPWAVATVERLTNKYVAIWEDQSGY